MVVDIGTCAVTWFKADLTDENNKIYEIFVKILLYKYCINLVQKSQEILDITTT